MFDKRFRTAAAILFFAGISSIPSVVSAGGTSSARIEPHSFLRSADPIKDEYIVVLDDANPEVATYGVDAIAGQLVNKHAAQLRHSYRHSITGFSIKATEAKARRIAAEPSVAYVVENSTVHADTIQTSPPWGLDRIDQRTIPLSGTYSYTYTGAGAHAYVIDSGINVWHAEFGGRASTDYTAIDDAFGATDCNGHGTHVAGTIGATTYGVAKGVRLHSVRALDCSGSGPTDGVIAAVDWVTGNAARPAVANMSVSTSSNAALNSAVTRSINAGIVYVVAAGNSASDACSYSPSGAFYALTVGATDSNDVRASFSNGGTCVDLFAPGVGIQSTWIGSNTATNTISGTSMAAPHVAGIAAQFLQANPGAKVADVVNAIISQSSGGKVINPGAGSPNHLASSLSIGPLVAIYRYFDNSSKHFYTTSWQELGGGGNGWTFEGRVGHLSPSAAPNTQPFYRYLNTANGDHFYTADWSTLGAGIGSWKYESIIGYCPTAASPLTQNLYRYYNPSTLQHFFTNNWDELGGGGANGWMYESVACLVSVKPV
jgi:hypothetical protein